MENQTSFDLDQHIQSWRENLGQSPAVRGENLNELEAHLRDSVSALQLRGLSGEEAFMVAAKRVGAGGLLAVEFGKVNRHAVWIDRMLWMLVGVQLWGAILGTVNGLAAAVSTLALASQNNTAVHGLVFPVIVLTLGRLLAVTGSLALCWWLVMRKGHYFETWMGRSLERRFSRFTIFGIGGVVVFGILLPYVINMFENALIMRTVEISRVNEVVRAQAFSELMLIVFNTATLLILTIILARKRQGLTQAG